MKDLTAGEKSLKWVIHAVGYLSVCFPTYLFFSFMSWDRNPLVWSPIAQVGFLVLLVLSGAMSRIYLKESWTFVLSMPLALLAVIYSVFLPVN